MLPAQTTLKSVQKMLGLKQKLQIQWEGIFFLNNNKY